MWRYCLKKPIRILIVDDQKMFRDGLERLIETQDSFSVIGHASNGFELLHILETIIPDVILLDIEMPEMDGADTLDILKKVFPEIKVIIITQYDEGELIKNLFNRGANAYVPKDTSYLVMFDAIQTVYSKGIYLDNLPQLETKSYSLKEKPYKLKFSRREREIIHLLCSGDQVSDIAKKLCISNKTVESNLTEIYKKACVDNKGEFLIYAMKEGLNYIGAD